MSTSSFAILGALDDTGEIEELDLGAAVPDHAGDARQCCELVRRHLGEGARELVQQCAFPDGWEPDHAHAAVARLGDVEAVAFGAGFSGAALDEVAAELGELRLERAEVRGGRLVLLRAAHLQLDRRDLLHDVGHLDSSSLGLGVYESLRVCVCTHCGAIRGGWRVRVRHTCVRRSGSGLKSSCPLSFKKVFGGSAFFSQNTYGGAVTTCDKRGNSRPRFHSSAPIAPPTYRLHHCS